MGIILGLIILAVIGFFIYWCLETKSHYDHFALELISLIIGVGAAICLTLFGGLCIIHKVNADLEYQNALQQHDAIVYRLEQTKNDKNLLINGGIYDDIVKYNNKIREYKKWKHNFWLNWFYPADIDELEYIELKNN